ncbi:hypothetical protein KC360_g106 [Hortaea werneckii]|nr:hypothetical protein KC344_g104 [Hortaea werneckii]KAI7180416.1 hypothetical protein KC360_g106 [Hortaea werneckii]
MLLSTARLAALLYSYASFCLAASFPHKRYTKLYSPSRMRSNVLDRWYRLAMKASIASGSSDDNSVGGIYLKRASTSRIMQSKRSVSASRTALNEMTTVLDIEKTLVRDGARMSAKTPSWLGSAFHS